MSRFLLKIHNLDQGRGILFEFVDAASRFAESIIECQETSYATEFQKYVTSGNSVSYLSNLKIGKSFKLELLNVFSSHIIRIKDHTWKDRLKSRSDF